MSLCHWLVIMFRKNHWEVFPIIFLAWHQIRSFEFFPQKRSSRPEVFSRQGVRRNFAKFTGKHRSQSLRLYLKRELWHRCFPVNFTKFLRAPFLRSNSGGCFCLKDLIFTDLLTVTFFWKNSFIGSFRRLWQSFQ